MVDAWRDEEDVTAEVFGFAVARASSPQPQSTTHTRYLILSHVGEGGMGVVSRAYDTKLAREVALKRLRPDAMGAEARARMISEARSMAQLNHPNVVRVYDVDSEDGEVAIAMEFIDGRSLSEWLQSRRTWGEIVDVFVQAGRGLAAAHRAGLLHRDFKPANVLLGTDGRARVTDFGLARVAAELDSDTRNGMILGTPVFMAPEQFVAGEPLDAAADQYAFCVSLWFALTGSLPFRKRPRELAEMRTEKLAGPPAWPAEVVLPDAIKDAIRRGLAPNPRDRWPSMERLLERLGAVSPQTRRRVIAIGVAVSMCVAIGAVVGIEASETRCAGAHAQIASAWDADKKSGVARVLEDSRVSPYIAQRVVDFFDGYADRWQVAYTDACEATWVHGERTESLLDLRMRCLGAAKHELLAASDAIVQFGADDPRELDALLRGLPRIETCADAEILLAKVAPPDDPELASAVERARRRLTEARVLDRVGQNGEARLAFESVLAEAQALQYPPMLAEALLDYGVKLISGMAEHDYAIAEATLRRAYSIATEEGQWDLVTNAAAKLTFLLGYQLHRYDEAMAYGRVAEALVDRPGIELKTRLHVAASVATVSEARGELEAAETRLRGALELWNESLTSDSSFGAMLHNNFCNVLNGQGKHVPAEVACRRAVELHAAAFDETHLQTATSRANLSLVLSDQAKFEEAEVELRASLAIAEEQLGPDSAFYGLLRNNLGAILSSRGRFADAATEFSASLDIRTRTLGPDHPQVAQSRYNLGDALMRLGRYEKAESLLKDAVASWRKSLGPEHPQLLYAHDRLGDLHTERGDVRAALVQFERGWAIARLAEIAPLRRATAAFKLARALRATSGDPARVEMLTEAALSDLGDGPNHAALRAELVQWQASSVEPARAVP